MKIELTEQQIKRIIELLEREWVNTGKAFYAGLSDNIVQQAIKQEFINLKLIPQ